MRTEEAISLTVHEHYRMAEFDEVLGPLHSIQETEFGLLALIGEIQVLLPDDLAGSLEGHLGRRVGTSAGMAIE